MNKNYLYIVVGLVAVITVAVLLSNKNNAPDVDLDTLISTPSLNTEPSPTPVETPRPKPGSTKPTPGLIFKPIKTYEQLTKEFELEGRWLALNDSCTEIVPSNVTYHNNAEIMLDNTASSTRHILKIGGREYLLEAGEWFLTTFYSPTLPAIWPIYCGSMELGSISIVQ